MKCQRETDGRKLSSKEKESLRLRVVRRAEGVQEADGSPSVRSERMNEPVEAYATSPSNESLQRLRLQHVVPWAKVYSHAFVEACGLRFDPIRRSNDVAFNVLAAVQANRLRAETQAVYRVYRRAESLTADVSAAAFMERFLANRSLAQRLAAVGIPRARYANRADAAVASVRSPSCGTCLVARDLVTYGDSMGAYFRSWSMAPIHYESASRRAGAGGDDPAEMKTGPAAWSSHCAENGDRFIFV